MIITRTPHRVSLLGGGTDYDSWSAQNGGVVLGAAVNQYSYVSVRRLPPYHDFKTRVVYSAIETVREAKDIQHRVVRAAVEVTKTEDLGLEIFHAADLPSRSGTGSSSAFAVGLLHALYCERGRYVCPAELADLAVHLEQNLLGDTVGRQDQTFAAHGGLNVLRFNKDGSTTVFPLALPREQAELLEEHLVLAFTRQARNSTDVARTYAHSLGDRAREQYAMMHLAEEGVLAARSGDFKKLGALVNQAWRIKAGLSDAVTTPLLSRMVNAALLAGAYGAKLTGAGGGGCVLAVAPPAKRKGVVDALEQEGCVHVPFRFDWGGSRVIFAE
jgi:D-glycero-alpha-D-manno-heptose-7-phosphate kinase